MIERNAESERVNKGSGNVEAQHPRPSEMYN
jgi:hypothetical protein